MFVEQRTYTLHAGCVPEYLRLYEAEGLPHQLPLLGCLVGYYSVEVGALNTVVHQWRFDDAADRDRRRAKLQADPNWKSYWAKVRPLIAAQESIFLKPAPFFAARLADLQSKRFRRNFPHHRQAHTMNELSVLHTGRHAKPAPADAPLHDLLRLRWSPRAFAPEPLPPGALRQLLEAARWAPSASNEQPWHFLLARREDETSFAALLDCLNPPNQVWARHAALLAVAVARLAQVSKPQPNRTAFYDLGQAVANMTVQATAMDLIVHQMAGFDIEKVRSRCGVPDGYEPHVAMAIGRPGDPSALPEPLQQREAAPRVRKPVSEFAFGSAWGSTVVFPTGS